MSAAYIVAARRTAVAPRHGAFKDVEARHLAEAPIRAVLADVDMPPEDIDEVILGNALYGGGNPARVAALQAGLPQTVPAITIDSQCCAGLDAIMFAAERIAAGAAHAIIAGGVESFSRSPLRLRRPQHPTDAPEPYTRPPFTPWPERDPEMTAAAADLAIALGVTRAAQEGFAIDSHRKALAGATASAEIVDINGLRTDAFARVLTPALCRRLPLLAGDPMHGITSATVAVEADAAAALLIVSEDKLRQLSRARPLRIIGAVRRGGDPTMPGTAPIAAANALLTTYGVTPGEIAVAEIMEAFAVQAMACIAGIGLRTEVVNRGGGALARGHPIGASGAILAVRLWHDMQNARGDAKGLAAIAAAGGLGSALLVAN